MAPRISHFSLRSVETKLAVATEYFLRDIFSRRSTFCSVCSPSVQSSLQKQQPVSNPHRQSHRRKLPFSTAAGNGIQAANTSKRQIGDLLNFYHTPTRIIAVSSVAFRRSDSFEAHLLRWSGSLHSFLHRAVCSGHEQAKSENRSLIAKPESGVRRSAIES